MDKYIKEAEKSGLKWLKKVTKDHSLYLFPCGCSEVRQMSSVRHKKHPYIQCSKCAKTSLEEKYIAEAEKIGITLVSKTGNRRTRLYKLACGHLEEKTVKQVKEGGVQCNQCIFDAYFKIGKSKGVTPIRHIPDGDYWLWEFNGCGHQRKMQPMNVKHGHVLCQECIKNKHNASALEEGLELLGRVKNSRYDANFREYRIKECGHKQIFSVSSVKNGSWRCDICLNNKINYEAEEKGLEKIGNSNRHGYNLYRFKKCQHEQEISTSQIRHATNISCQVCGENNWYKPSYIYLLKIKTPDKTWIKLGHTENLKIRFEQYGLPQKALIDIIYQKKLNTRIEALTIEQNIHNELEDRKLNPKLMKSFHTKSGFTECYPQSLSNSILTLLEENIPNN